VCAVVVRRRCSALQVNAIATPMPGVCIQINVEIGDEVSAGQTVAVMEAMKMQNSMRSPRAGVVKAIYAVAGQTLDSEQVIIELEEEEEEAAEEAK
jgi:biotin carboxyl carrier protein